MLLGFRFCDERVSSLPSSKDEAKQMQAAINSGKLQSSHANRKIVCLQMSERVSVIVVFLSKQVTYEFSVTIHSAGHDIFCKHGLLQESSCSNMRFVCKITLIPAFEEIPMCVCVADPCRFIGG